jgi:6-phosphogluconolactonase
MSAPVEVFATPEALFEAAAARVASALARKDRVTFALAGGSTPERMYERLADRDAIPWRRVEFFWGDERPVGPDSPESNYGMARRSLLAPAGIAAERVHRIEGERAPEDAARRYEDEIRRLVPGDPVPHLDLVLLGMGEDGHTASLFPGTSWDETRLVVANPVPKLGATRITMTPLLLNAARSIVFLAAGEGKADALRRVVEERAPELPASRIEPEAGDLVWLVDRAAASRLHR